jgi:hypothetical protein
MGVARPGDPAGVEAHGRQLLGADCRKKLSTAASLKGAEFSRFGGRMKALSEWPFSIA